MKIRVNQKYGKMDIIKLIFFSMFLFLQTTNCETTYVYYQPTTTNPTNQPDPIPIPSDDEAVAKCKKRGEIGHVRSFSDCNTESSFMNICCFLTGTNNGEKYDGCIAMDREIFANKSLSYKVKTISGTLICDENYNSDIFFNFNIFFLYFYIFILMTLI